MNRARLRQLLVLLLLACTLLVVLPAPAQACSCAGGGPKEMLENHEAAFIGTLVQRSGGLLGGNATWTFEVTREIKGTFSKTVKIVSAASGAACGFELEEGAEAAIFVRVEGGRLHSGLCSTLDADAMRAFLDPQPIVDARPTMLVAASGSPRHLWLFDDEGRLAAASADRRGALLEDVALCPGGRTLVELWSGKVVVRELRGLRAVSVHRVPRNLGRIWCSDRAGRQVMGARRDDTTGDWAAIVDVRSSRRPVLEGAWVHVEIVGGQLLATVGREDTQLRRIDLRTGRERLLHRATERPGVQTEVSPGIEGFSVSPDGTRVAFEVTIYPVDGPQSSDIFVYDIATGRRMATAFQPAEGMEVRWVDNRSLLFSSYEEDAQLLTAQDLSVQTTLPAGTFWVSARARDGSLLGMDGPRLAAVDPATGDVRTLATVPAEYVSWVKRLPRPLTVRATATVGESEAPAELPIGRPDPRGEAGALGTPELRGTGAVPIVPVAAAVAVAVLGVGSILVRRGRRRRHAV